MFESIMKLVRKVTKKEDQTLKSKDAAKERLHLVLMQDRANVSADFLDLMKQEIIDVIKKYIDIDESAIDVKLTNKDNGDGTNGAPALYANIPILNIKDEVRQTANIKTSEDDKDKDKKLDVEKTERVIETHEQEEKEEITIIEENSKLDKEAILRGTSIYMMDRVIPMLPRELSNGICSLNQGEDRFAISVIMEINKDGKVV